MLSMGFVKWTNIFADRVEVPFTSLRYIPHYFYKIPLERVKCFRGKLYDNIRLKFFNEITAKYSIFIFLSLFLCNSIDPAVCRATAAFVFHAMSLRHETLFSN